MSILGRFIKQPNEILDYDVDYTDWFAGRADTPSSHEVVVPAGITLQTTVRNGNVVKVVLSGGTVGQKYHITVRLTTTSGIIKEADFVITVKEF